VERRLDSEGAIAQCLAAAIIDRLTRSGTDTTLLPAIGRQFASGTQPLTGFGDLCRVVEGGLEGVHFREVVEALGGEGDDLFTQVLAGA
jgi:hypothetical protein